MLKMGALGGAALLVPLQRLALASDPERIASSKLPKPFTRPFRIPPTATPVAGPDPGTDYYSIDMVPVQANIIDGLPTTMWGYNGAVPGPTIDVMQGRKVVMRQRNLLPNNHLGHAHIRVGAPPRFGVAPPVRRLCK
jgi:FtsP/CotA-like multicopper oxidase with cupredoxin domain